MALYGHAQIKRAVKSNLDEGSMLLPSKSSSNTVGSNGSDVKFVKSVGCHHIVKNSCSADSLDKKIVTENSTRRGSPLTIDVDVINIETEPTLLNSGRRPTPTSFEGRPSAVKIPKPSLPPRVSPTGNRATVLSPAVSKPVNNSISNSNSGPDWIAVKGVPSVRPCTANRSANYNLSSSSSSKFLPPSRTGQTSVNKVPPSINKPSVGLSLNVQKLQNSSNSSRVSLSIAAPQFTPAARPAVPKHEILSCNQNNTEQISDENNGEIREIRVCGNPLCRRKWKRLNNRYLPTLCPTCRKGLEALAMGAAGTDESLIACASSLKEEGINNNENNGDDSRGGLTDASDPNTLIALKTIWTRLLTDIMDLTQLPVFTSSIAKNGNVDISSSATSQNKKGIADCLTVRSANVPSPSGNSPMLTSSPTIETPPTIEQIAFELDTSLPAPPDAAEVRNWNSSMSRKGLISGVLIRRKASIWELILKPDTLQEVLQTIQTNKPLSLLESNCTDPNPSVFSDSMLDALNTLKDLQGRPGQASPPPSPTLRRETAKSTLLHGLIIHSSQRVLGGSSKQQNNNSNSHNNYNKNATDNTTNSNHSRIFAIDWSPEDSENPPAPIQLVRCLLLLNPSLPERSHLPYLIKVTERGDASKLSDLAKWMMDILPSCVSVPSMMTLSTPNTPPTTRHDPSACNVDTCVKQVSSSSSSSKAAAAQQNLPLLSVPPLPCSAPFFPPNHNISGSNTNALTSNNNVNNASLVPPPQSSQMGNMNHNMMAGIPFDATTSPSAYPPPYDMAAVAAALHMHQQYAFHAAAAAHHAALVQHCHQQQQQQMIESPAPSFLNESPQSPQPSSHAQSIFAALNKAIDHQMLNTSSSSSSSVTSSAAAAAAAAQQHWFHAAALASMHVQTNSWPPLPSGGDFSAGGYLVSPLLIDPTCQTASRAAADIANSESDVSGPAQSMLCAANFPNSPALLPHASTASIPNATASPLLAPWVQSPLLNPFFFVAAQQAAAAAVAAASTSHNSNLRSSSSSSGQSVCNNKHNVNYGNLSDQRPPPQPPIDQAIPKGVQEPVTPAVPAGMQPVAGSRGRSSTSSRSRCCRSHSPQAHCGGRISLKDIYRNVRHVTTSNKPSMVPNSSQGVMRRSVSSQSDGGNKNNNSHLEECEYCCDSDEYCGEEMMSS